MEHACYQHASSLARRSSPRPHYNVQARKQMASCRHCNSWIVRPNHFLRHSISTKVEQNRTEPVGARIEQSNTDQKQKQHAWTPTTYRTSTLAPRQ